MNATIKLTYKDFNGNIIETPEEGQRAYCPETQQIVEYKNGEWKTQTAQLTMGAYEMNQQLVNNLPIMGDATLSAAADEIAEWARTSKNKYYMLLCNDLKYYTLFKTNSERLLDLPFSEEIITCLQNVGDIKAIDPIENAFEIWITKDEQSYVFYLFEYDEGVIECRK